MFSIATFLFTHLRTIGLRNALLVAGVLLFLAAEGAALRYTYMRGKEAVNVQQLTNDVKVEQKVRSAGTRARATDTSISLRDGSF